MKILLILDLDYTHFITHLPGTNWIGEKAKRLQLYLDLIEKAKLQNIEVIFAVVSAKSYYDDLCKEAAIAFKDLLQRMNAHMYATFDGLDYLLLKHQGQLVYKCLHNGNNLSAGDIPDRHSHFHLVYPAGEKITAMLEIGSIHDIPAERIIFLDDDKILLDKAKDRGMNIVSFNCFSPTNSERVAYNDTTEINRHLDAIHEQLHQIFDACLLKLEESAKQEDEPEVKRAKFGT
jgi:hypothetical protein